MSNTASIVFLVAETDVPAVEEVYGRPYRNDEGSLPNARRLAYPEGLAAVDTVLAHAIAAKLPLAGDIAPSIQQPGHAFCAIDGHYHEWPQIHGQPCVLLRQDRRGDLSVDWDDLRRAREFWKQHRRALNQIQERCCAAYRQVCHDDA